ncbi:hypothetical protein SSBR45G_70000 [Bradyrhizobium sp. SSBR45G]|uniref:hypothetical protein n=1 Tax=unclassified Bradyrhizobium TaxID=2631580 RepID=UPI002342B122|nr:MULTISPECIES: hypothetical protein [unclassified Bradyrhizobium]GLH82091.1 hypothetical protein SSBR45G_70000 [Bradyrhizobium sp. SSBR45G]GLH89523.1 hypothetical protein SSBR45R_69840 [Bradyrhizobium sp. SSBR45R]
MPTLRAGFVKTAGLVAVGTVLAVASARADVVPPFKGNDTGGIIAYQLAQTTDARQLAVDHCASYGKVAKFRAVDPHYGGYVSFACRWVPYGSAQRPLRTLY